VSDLPARRLLLVHAHPDDETIGTGATMAHYAATGAHVTLVTCTLGEEGEIHVPELAGLAAAEADQLGGYRITELRAACAALGVTDLRFLGGAGRYRDSGMMGLPTNDHPRAFWRADLDEAAGHLVEVMPKDTLRAVLRLPGAQRMLPSVGIDPAVLEHNEFGCWFDRANTTAGLAGTDITVPPLADYAPRIWKYWTENGA